MDMRQYGQRLFEEITGCVSDFSEADGYFVLGETRYIEVWEFVDKFMQAWVNQPMFTTTADFSPTNLSRLYKSRFCTYKEYEQLFTSSQGQFNAPVFILLDITDEKKHAKFKRLFPKSLDGYFRCMKVYCGALHTFFFPAVHSGY